MDLKRLIRDIKNTKGEIYKGILAIRLGNYIELKEAEEIVNVIKLPNDGKKIVELGASQGWLSSYLSEVYKNNQYIAIEKDEKIVKKTKNMIKHSKIDYRTGDATCLEFGDKTIDIFIDKQLIDRGLLNKQGIFASTVFKHLQETSRTLKKDRL